MDERPLPLEGITVIEVGQVISAPYAGLLLADLGADVIKIEPPGTGDSARNPEVTGMKGESATFITFNRNKRSVCLDLKDPQHRRRMAALVSGADVLLSNIVPSVAARLGLDEASLREINADLIVCNIQGFASDDPRSDLPSYDLVHQALAGYMLLEGRQSDPPLRVSVPLADLAAALFAVYGVLAALFARQRGTSAGERVEVPMFDSLLSLLTYTGTLYLNEGIEPQRAGNGHAHVVPWQAVRAQDGDLVVAVRSDKFWRRFCEATGLQALVDDDRFATNDARVAHRTELTSLIEDRFQDHPVDTWLTRLEEVGVPCAPVKTVGEALEDAAAREGDLVHTLHHPALGELRLVGNPVRFTQLATASMQPPPSLGQHTEGLAHTDRRRVRSEPDIRP